MTKRDDRAPLLLKVITPAFFAKKVLPFSGKHRDFFILSSGRTATTFLANLFDSRPDIIGLHEPKPSRILRMWSMAYIDGRVSKSFMRYVLQLKRQQLYSNSSQPTYVESNPYLVGFADVLQDVFANPFVIHVVRDPRDFVTSALNHGNDRGLKLFFNKYVPFWHPDLKKYLHYDGPLPMNYQSAAYWVAANETLLAYGEAHPGRYLLLRYEDLFSGDGASMRKLFETVNVDVELLTKSALEEQSINSSRYTTTNKWQKWSREDCHFVNKYCGKLMKRFGYGEEPEWKAKLVSKS